MINRGQLGEIPYALLTPGDTTGLPLVLVLHGANSSAEVLATFEPLVESMWAEGTLPECVLACASTPTAGGFYIGEWESFVAHRFPSFLGDEFGVGRSGIGLVGSSMGGYGALKIAFADPSRWRAVAAIAPALLSAKPLPRNSIGVLARLAEEMNAAGYEANNVLHRLRANASAIRAGGLPIFLRCGDRDVFSLHDGTEQLHRALWELDIGHEYHLVFGGDHLGPEAFAAQRAAFAFVGAALRPDPGESQDEIAWRQWAAEGRQGPPPPLDPSGPAAPTAIRLMLEAELASAAQKDSTATRRYGVIC